MIQTLSPQSSQSSIQAQGNKTDESVCPCLICAYKQMENLSKFEAAKSTSSPISPKRFRITAEDNNLVLFFAGLRWNLQFDTNRGYFYQELSGTPSQQIRQIREMLERNAKPFAKVTELDLSNLDLAAIPKELFEYFPNLNKLNLSMNRLTSVPKEISTLQQVSLLDLSMNRLTEIDGICGLAKLAKLFLFSNCLSKIPQEMSHLDLLEEADFDLNRIDEFPSMLSTLPRLKTLSLQRNRISTVPQLRRGFQKLNTLNLNYNFIEASHKRVRLNLPFVKSILLESQKESPDNKAPDSPTPSLPSSDEEDTFHV